MCLLAADVPCDHTKQSWIKEISTLQYILNENVRLRQWSIQILDDCRFKNMYL